MNPTQFLEVVRSYLVGILPLIRHVYLPERMHGKSRNAIYFFASVFPTQSS
ncbi:MAG: hypothetical protein ACI8S3_001833 [Alphaproteobacteria bacterium]|jgi:hypothetical protein